MTSRTPAPTPPDCVTLAENFLANETIWPLGVNSKIATAIRKFATWARGELEVGAMRGAPDVSLAATPAREDVANALQICEGWTADGIANPGTMQSVLWDLSAVARLLRAALGKLEARA